MARIRSIKPEFCSSATISALSIPCRLHFIMLWMYADDRGRGIDNPLLIKAALWPLDEEIAGEQIEALQAELEAHGRLIRYEAEGRKYFEIVNFPEHQKPNRPRPSLIPAPSVTDHERLTEPSVNGHGLLSVVEIPHVEKEQVKPDTEPSVSEHGGRTAVVVGEGRGEGAGAPRVRARPGATLDAAVELLLLRLGKPEIATTKANPEGWLASTRRGLKTEHHDQAKAIFERDPEISAEALADALVPPIQSAPVEPPEEYVAEGVGKGVPMPAELKRDLRRKLKRIDDEVDP